MKKTLQAIGVTLFILPFSAALQAAEQGPEKAEIGRNLAQKHCAGCHAVGDEVKSPHKDAPPFRDFASKWPLENLEEALAEGIVTGHPDMPAFVFEPKDIDVLLEYLHTLALKDPARQ